MNPDKSCLVNCDRFGRQAQFFESFVVPLWQEIYDSLVNRGGIRPGNSVLDAGTGTGEVALRAGSAVGRSGRVTAVDVQPEMLKIAEAKAARRGARNIRFMESSVEKMDLPNGTFDAVLANYSLCCCMEYGPALSEINRVLKPGGRLTYNHGGLSDSDAIVMMTDIFEKYKTGHPSESLRGLRESDQSLKDAVDRYRAPHTTLDLLKRLGYVEPKAEVVRRVLAYKDARALVDRIVAFDWSSEVAEISPKEVKRFSEEAVEALSQKSGSKFMFEDDMVFFTAVKE